MSGYGEQPPAPAPQGPGRRQLPTWVAVAVTAGVMLAIGVAFVVGVVVGAALDRSGSTAANDPAAGGTPGGQAPGGAGGGAADDPATLDDCLVGTWTSTEHTEDWTTDQGAAELSGLQRTMAFTADGTQTVTYDGSQATITSQGRAVPARFDGEVVYRTSTSGATMSFESVSAEGTVTIDPDGAAKVEELEPGTGDVTYSCDDAELRQEAEGYLSVYERTG